MSPTRERASTCTSSWSASSRRGRSRWVTTRLAGRRGEPRAVQLLQRLRREPAGGGVLAHAPPRRVEEGHALQPGDDSASSCSTPPIASLAEQVNLTSKEIPPDESEVALTGLTTVAEREGEAAAGRGVAGATGVRGAADHPVRHRPDRGEPRDRRGGDDPRRRRRARRQAAASTRGSCGPWPASAATFWCHTSDLFEQKRP